MPRFLIVLVCACLGAAGVAYATSATSLADRLVAPGGVSPLMDDPNIAVSLATLPNRSGYVTTGAGVALFWRAVDPGDYRMRYAYRGVATGDDGNARLDYTLRIDPRGAAATAPRGTVVLLHGWMMDGDSLLPWSVDFAQAGFRTINLDLRNHGRSGTGPAGYGTREGQDVVDAVRALRASGEIVGPLHLFGVSYGAATALLAARALGDDVAGVIAMESFDNAGGAIRDMVPHMLAKSPVGLEKRAAMQVVRWRYADHDMDALIASADRTLGIDLDKVDVGAAARGATACVLLLHGSDDQHIPVAHGRALAAAAPKAQYVELRGENHLSLPMRVDVLGRPLADWLSTDRKAGHCAPLRLTATRLAAG